MEASKPYERMLINNEESLNKVMDFVEKNDVQYKHHDSLFEERDRTEARIVSREDWGAAPAEESKVKIENLDKPARVITFSSTWTDTCKNKEECSKILKKLQEKHIEAGVNDIIHNFMIDDEGTIYEGRGWNKENFRWVEGEILHKNTINIGYIGKYREPNNMPNEKMLDAAFSLIRLGVEKGFIYKRYRVSELGFFD